LAKSALNTVNKPSVQTEKMPVSIHADKGRATKSVLLVEDNEDDLFFIKRAWQQASVSNPLQVLHDGNQALDYLGGVGKYADRDQFPLPCLVILDWKLPYLMGEEVLKEIRRQPPFKSLPVLVLSTSARVNDIDRAYQLGANAYLEKPSTESRLLDLIKLIKSFWLDTIKFSSNQS
jgi:CheY-like chemotaxis protein